MNNSLKNVIVVIVSILLGGTMMTILHSLVVLWFPVPDNVDFSDVDFKKVYMASAPAGKLSLILLSHAIGAFLSGLFISRFAGSSVAFLAMITGLIWTMFGVVNIVTINHPVWFSIADTCIFLPLTILGTKYFDLIK